MAVCCTPPRPSVPSGSATCCSSVAPCTSARDVALGTVLVRDGAVTRQDLAAGIEEQAVEILARICALDGATFMFSGEEPVPSGIEIVPLAVEQIVVAAEQRSVSRFVNRLLQRLL